MNFTDTLMLWNSFSMLRWDPLRQLDELQSRFHRLVDIALPLGIAGSGWRPLIDVTEAENEFTVKVELPEVKKEDVKVTFEYGSLTISGERKQEKQEGGCALCSTERLYGSFSRTLALPPGLDSAKSTAKFEGGILTVHLPKRGQANAHVIQIE